MESREHVLAHSRDTATSGLLGSYCLPEEPSRAGPVSCALGLPGLVPSFTSTG